MIGTWRTFQSVEIVLRYFISFLLQRKRENGEYIKKVTFCTGGMGEYKRLLKMKYTLKKFLTSFL